MEANGSQLRKQYTLLRLIPIMGAKEFGFVAQDAIQGGLSSMEENISGAGVVTTFAMKAS